MFDKIKDADIQRIGEDRWFAEHRGRFVAMFSSGLLILIAYSTLLYFHIPSSIFGALGITICVAALFLYYRLLLKPQRQAGKDYLKECRGK